MLFLSSFGYYFEQLTHSEKSMSPFLSFLIMISIIIVTLSQYDFVKFYIVYVYNHFEIRNSAVSYTHLTLPTKVIV